MADFNPFSNLFKALMHPVRISILEILREGEHCVCHLEAVLGYRQAYISQHLMVLREAGLIEDRREGARIYYQVIRPEVFELLNIASEMVGASPRPELQAEVKDCPCPKCNPVAAV